MVIQYAIVRGTEKLGTARCIEAEQHSEMRKLELDFAGKTGVGVEKLAEHLNEHGRNFGFTAEEEYLQAAKKFLKTFKHQQQELLHLIKVGILGMTKQRMNLD